MQDVLFRFRINFNKIEVANFIFNNGNQRDKKNNMEKLKYYSNPSQN